MLDTDTTDTTDTTENTGNAENGGNADASDSSGTADTSAVPAPRKRAPRKATARKTTLPVAEIPSTEAASTEAASTAVAPGKRAPRTAAAKKAAQPESTAGTDVTSDAVPDATPEAPPAKRAPRKRAAKTVPASDPAPVEPNAGAAAAEELPAVPATKDVPATKATRKRAAKKVAGNAVEPAAENATDATTPAESAPAAMSSPGVLFMAPDDSEPAPTRRRRTSKKAAAPAAEQADASESAASDVAPDITAAAAASDAADDTDDADPDDVREAAIEQANGARRRRRRGRRGRGGAARTDDDAADGDDTASDAGDDTAKGADASEQGDASESDDTEGDDSSESSGSSRRRRRRRRSNAGDDASGDDSNDPPNTVTHVREKKSGKNSGDSGRSGDDDGVRGIKGSTRLEAKRQRRRDGRETTRRRAPILTEAEFLARREAVDRVMAVRQHGERTQIAVLEDDILVEHYVTRASATSYVGNVYLGKVQNVLPSMEAAFVDIGKGRNGVLYAGEVNWDAAGLDGKSRTIEHAMKSGDSVLVQVTKDPIGHKGARLTSQVSLPGRFLVYVPGGGMTGISRRLPDTERHRLKSILKKIVPDEAGVIVRTAAEGASEQDLTHDVERLQAQWESIEKKAKDGQESKKGSAPVLLHGEPDLAIRVVRDVFNEDFTKLVVDGEGAWSTVSEYVGTVAPDLAERVSRHGKDTDLFHDLRVDEQLAKALDRKVWLPSGGSLVIDRTEAMTVVDVNTGRFVGSGGNLEQTVTRNNLEAAEEIVRQLRLRDVGGIVVIDFIDMVLESNRDLVLRRLTECLGRDRTKHQVAEVTSLGLVQMTRKRVGEGLLEAFSEPCEHCHGRGVIVHTEPVDQKSDGGSDDDDRSGGGRKRGRRGGRASEPAEVEPAASVEQRQAATAAIAAIHRATSTTDGSEADEDSTPSALTTLANDLVNAAMVAGNDDTPAPTRQAANGHHEVEPSGDASALSGNGAEPEAAEAVSSASEAAAPEPEPEPEPAAAAGPPARRRRRAASRPAGPPVHA